MRKNLTSFENSGSESGFSYSSVISEDLGDRYLDQTALASLERDRVDPGRHLLEFAVSTKL